MRDISQGVLEEIINDFVREMEGRGKGVGVGEVYIGFPLRRSQVY